MSESNKKYTILSIEDDEIYATFLDKLITLHIKADFYHKSSPAEALDWLLDNKPDLVLLDLELPGMDGIKTLQTIRVQLGSDVKVIPCSTLSNSTIIQKLLKLGIEDYIIKSSPSKVIAQKIKKALDSIEE
jgi:DNA-binding NarL/FixJ family response regulator